MARAPQNVTRAVARSTGAAGHRPTAPSRARKTRDATDTDGHERRRRATRRPAAAMPRPPRTCRRRPARPARDARSGSRKCPARRAHARPAHHSPSTGATCGPAPDPARAGHRSPQSRVLGSGRRVQLSRSRARSARSVSACELTDTYSPAAIDMAPATRPATPATKIALRRRRRRDAEDQAGRGDDAVVGAQHGRPQPADAADEMVFGMRAKTTDPLLMTWGGRVTLSGIMPLAVYIWSPIPPRPHRLGR